MSAFKTYCCKTAHAFSLLTWAGLTEINVKQVVYGVVYWIRLVQGGERAVAILNMVNGPACSVKVERSFWNSILTTINF